MVLCTHPKPKGCSNYCAHAHLYVSYTDDLKTVLYFGNNSMPERLLCTNALPDDWLVRPKTCRSLVKLTIITLKCMHFISILCNNYIIIHGVKNVKYVVSSLCISFHLLSIVTTFVHPMGHRGNFILVFKTHPLTVKLYPFP
jgi:hypothetical protein